MNGSLHQATPDLLPHKYRPNSLGKLAKCHIDQALSLKQWIQDFISLSSKPRDYSDESDLSRDSICMGNRIQVEKKCALLTGPPGVGKTSLVYTIANELNLHVVESHPSEKRDFKLFSTLKLANQKGKINPIAKLFQAAQFKQVGHREVRRKRRKLSDSSNLDQPDSNGKANDRPTSQCLSLSGDSSIVLFDDIDVVFEDDGPFLKSLVEFIRDSKRPVILTATQSIDMIKEVLVHFEHIHLDRPLVDDCTQLLRDVCKQEQLNRLNRSIANCRLIADRLNCDIRQCLNRIHFYGNEASKSLGNDGLDESLYSIAPDLTRLNISKEPGEVNTIHVIEFEDDEKTIEYYDANSSDTEVQSIDDAEKLDASSKSDHDFDRDELQCANRMILNSYSTASLIDLMNSKFNHVSKGQLLDSWLDCKPTPRIEEYDFNHDLGERIKGSIVELSRKIFTNELSSQDELLTRQRECERTKRNSCHMSSKLNARIKSRIEPPDKEFYTDIIPMLGQTIVMEGIRRQAGNQVNVLSSNSVQLSPFATSSRRSRRVPSYLESISVYIEPEDYAMVSDNLLTEDRLALLDR